jgi:hypothetical protein
MTARSTFACFSSRAMVASPLRRDGVVRVVGAQLLERLPEARELRELRVEGAVVDRRRRELLLDVVVDAEREDARPRPGVATVAEAVQHVLAELRRFAGQVARAVVEEVAVDLERVRRGGELEEAAARQAFGTVVERREGRRGAARAREHLAERRRRRRARAGRPVAQLLRRPRDPALRSACTTAISSAARSAADATGPLPASRFDPSARFFAVSASFQIV